MADNVFYQFDSDKTNMMSTSEYGVQTALTGGVGSGKADSRLHNKLFYQMSTITSALAQVLRNCAIDMGTTVEASFTSVVTQLSKIMVLYSQTSTVLKVRNGSETDIDIYTKIGVEGYVSSVLGLYSTTAQMNQAIADAIGSGTTSTAKITDITHALTVAFSDTPETYESIPLSSYQASAKDIQDGLSTTKFISPGRLAESKHIPLLDPIPTGQMIVSDKVGNEYKWVSKAVGTVVGEEVVSRMAGYLSRSDVPVLNFETGYVKIPASRAGVNIDVIFQWGYIDFLTEGTYRHNFTTRGGINFPNLAFTVIMGDTVGQVIQGAGAGSDLPGGSAVTAIDINGFTWYCAFGKKSTQKVRFLAVGY